MVYELADKKTFIFSGIASIYVPGMESAGALVYCLLGAHALRWIDIVNSSDSSVSMVTVSEPSKPFEVLTR